MRIFFKILAILLAITSSIECSAPLVAPYVDILIPEQPRLAEISKATGLKAFTLAFVLAGEGKCKPMWGAQAPMDYEEFITQIKELKAIGGQVIVATGGAASPYLEAECSTPKELSEAYKIILDIAGSDHLDIDIEGIFNFDRMNEALVMLQKDRPNSTLSFTLVVQGDNYGVSEPLGVDVLKNAAKHGVRVDVVNPMTMEFDSALPSYGEAVIAASKSTVKQMKKVWPEKSDAQLMKMLGITPMIGKNNNGKIFTLEDAQNLVDWANDNQIGRLAFWSVGRDNGKCANGGVDSSCSSIKQNLFQFSQIFNGFNGTKTKPRSTTPSHIIESSTQHSVTEGHVNHETTTSIPTTHLTHAPIVVNCKDPNALYFPHDSDCNKYYRCYDGEPHAESCPGNTIWDIDNHTCNWPENVKNRPECKH